MSEDKTTSEARKTWEYENSVPINFKVTTLDKEYLFVHPHEHERIVNELEAKIVDLEDTLNSFKKVTLYFSAFLNSKLVKL